jgi:hypothetical protein
MPGFAEKAEAFGFVGTGRELEGGGIKSKIKN